MLRGVLEKLTLPPGNGGVCQTDDDGIALSSLIDVLKREESGTLRALVEDLSTLQSGALDVKSTLENLATQRRFFMHFGDAAAVQIEKRDGSFRITVFPPLPTLNEQEKSIQGAGVCFPHYVGSCPASRVDPQVFAVQLGHLRAEAMSEDKDKGRRIHSFLADILVPALNPKLERHEGLQLPLKNKFTVDENNDVKVSRGNLFFYSHLFLFNSLVEDHGKEAGKVLYELAKALQLANVLRKYAASAETKCKALLSESMHQLSTAVVKIQGLAHEMEGPLPGVVQSLRQMLVLDSEEAVGSCRSLLEDGFASVCEKEARRKKFRLAPVTPDSVLDAAVHNFECAKAFAQFADERLKAVRSGEEAELARTFLEQQQRIQEKGAGEFAGLPTIRDCLTTAQVLKRCSFLSEEDLTETLVESRMAELEAHVFFLWRLEPEVLKEQTEFGWKNIAKIWEVYDDLSSWRSRTEKEDCGSDNLEASRVSLFLYALVLLVDRVVCSEVPEWAEFALPPFLAFLAPKLALHLSERLKLLREMEVYVEGRRQGARAGLHKFHCFSQVEDLREKKVETMQNVFVNRRADMKTLKEDLKTRTAEKLKELKDEFEKKKAKAEQMGLYHVSAPKKPDKNMDIQTFEPYLSDDEYHANAYIFERCLPHSVRTLRQLLWRMSLSLTRPGGPEALISQEVKAARTWKDLEKTPTFLEVGGMMHRLEELEVQEFDRWDRQDAVLKPRASDLVPLVCNDKKHLTKYVVTSLAFDHLIHKNVKVVALGISTPKKTAVGSAKGGSTQFRLVALPAWDPQYPAAFQHFEGWDKTLFPGRHGVRVKEAAALKRIDPWAPRVAVDERKYLKMQWALCAESHPANENAAIC
eukprot:Cvel_17509.t1-p1 / transcript=Cvel_17509.t1 / gene=Cvel_17509 / organism=Chromera_velia_CCMP2878 / gene_product=hypothetical protein / transcript_product=hypothetical protein / location=Cvel_scaffold1403:425-5433(-) / protein_length=865 / sequence_SO=supercontig / SO=protein_coding / is_pseudo=false